MCKLISLDTKLNVADIKSECIKNIIKSAPICNAINYIILFGSSLEERCTEQSDIDFAIISSKGVSYIQSLKSFDNFMKRVYEFDNQQEYDVLYFKSLDTIKKSKDKNPLYKDLIEKGQIIYERK